MKLHEKQSLLALLVALGSACHPIPSPESEAEASPEPPPASASPEADTRPADGVTPPEPEQDPMHALELVQKVVEKTAENYASEKAAAQEFAMTLRVRIEGKPASLKANLDQIDVLEGAAGAGAADVTIELLREQGMLILEGKATLRSLVADSDVQSDNDQGLARFVEFLDP